MTRTEFVENDNLIAYIEKKANWRFPEGINQGLRSARLTLDPVLATQRPFFFYASIYCINCLSHAVLYHLGYRRRAEYCTAAASVYHRPAIFRNERNFNEQPIIFIHGIGIGFAHYLGLMCNFPTEVDVYLLEWPHVAMQMATGIFIFHVFGIYVWHSPAP